MTEQWNEPDGINPRGTVIVAAGRGENVDVYARFGRRIAADGYKVRVLPDVTTDLPAGFAAAEKLLVDDALPGPRVVAGSDTGALFALALAARGAPGLDGVITAGIPRAGVRPAIDLTGFDDEVEARTACPNHQGVLGRGGATPGAVFSAQIPTELIDPVGSVTVPVLGLHGGDDKISPLDGVRGRYAGGSLLVIEGGRHDILNDVTHRTVAAHVILFLERLRLGADLPVITKEAS
ncbi:alpha/beta fold hydrolase [Winogradskya consettensis]|uniref:Lysophospholipase n=1 Tax=Winogradskya consettensis TaxID=113560 RepID=A0A919SML0_9ACTN|nr:hypothetical protein [Actinoplanes consettensis]GIM74519.1 lysophospholipase [Actinoplanes consettensis]